MVVRNRPGWFNKASEPVLELLEDVSPYSLNASSILFNLQDATDDPPGKSSIYRTLDDLVKNGYLESEEGARGSDFYSITERGRAYLEGDLDAEELEE